MEPIKETEQEEDRSVPLWEEGKAKDRRIKEVALTVDLERGVSRTIPRKRRGEEEKSRKNKAKLQYPLVGENWGEEETVILPMSLRTTPLLHNPPISQPPTPLPPPSIQIPLLAAPKVSTPSTVNQDDSSQPQESFVQGFSPVYVGPSVDHMHAGHLGEATLRGGTVASPTPQPLPLPTFII